MIFIRQTIYIDVLICVNLFTNFLILSVVSRFMNIKARFCRKLCGAALGAVASLIILLPQLNGIINIIIKIILSLSIVFIVYGKKNIKMLVKIVSVFFLITFSFCGVMIAIWLIINPGGFILRNSTVYINISPEILIILTLVCYLIIRLINRVAGRAVDSKLYAKLKVTVNGSMAELDAKLDTGNTLREPFSGLPVIVAEKSAFSFRTIDKEYNYLDTATKDKVRFIPYSSLGGNGLLPAYKAESVIIDGKPYIGECYVALCDNGIIKGGINALLSADFNNY